MKITRAEIEAKRTPKGGWTRKQLAEWGVPWPPPSGWRKQLEGGAEFDVEQFDMSPIRTGVLAHDLLHQVVMAVVSAGHASDLYAFPDVLEYFGSRVPEGEEAAEAYGPATRDIFAPKQVA